MATRRAVCLLRSRRRTFLLTVFSPTVTHSLRFHKDCACAHRLITKKSKQAANRVVTLGYEVVRVKSENWCLQSNSFRRAKFSKVSFYEEMTSLVLESYCGKKSIEDHPPSEPFFIPSIFHKKLSQIQQIYFDVTFSPPTHPLTVDSNQPNSPRAYFLTLVFTQCACNCLFTALGFRNTARRLSVTPKDNVKSVINNEHSTQGLSRNPSDKNLKAGVLQLKCF